MKKMKKLASLLLALVMTLCLAAPAFAADDTYSITINNAANGETYKAYKLLDLSVNEAKDAFTYTLPEKGAFNSLFTAENSIFTVKDGVVTSTAENDSDAIKAFAQSAADLVTGTTAVAGQATAANGTAKIENLEPGYYLVISGKGTIAMIDTTPTDPDAQINEKNETPSIAKEIVPVAAGNQPGIGDSVNYKVTITAQPGAENYVMTDKMSTGLTFNNDVEIAGLTNGTDYTVKTDVTDATFTVTFTETYLKTITAETTIVVTYSATINADAVAVDKMTNTAKLDYGNDSKTDWTDTESENNKVTSYVYGFDLTKTNSAGTQLSGAKFELYASNADDAAAIELVAVTGGYRVATENDTDTTTTIEAGKVNIDGLGKGTYYLKETEAPEGYNALNGLVTIEITGDNTGKVTMPGKTAEEMTGGVTIVNLTGAELPSTGGIGTTIFYTVGGLLVIGAGVLLVVKKRMSIAD